MKSTLKLFVLATFFVLASCNKGNQSNLDYIYSDKPDVISCDISNKDLIKEAVYSFEADITNQYSPNQPDLRRAYASFMATARNKRIPYLEMVSPQTIKIFEAIKADGTIYNGQSLNAKSPVLDCVAKNIKDVGFKTTFNALLSTNSLRDDIIIPPLTAISRNMLVDKYLSTYAALEFYYKGLFNIDLTKVKGRPQAKVDFNNTPTTAPSNGTNRATSANKDPHSGHNH